MTEKQIKLSEEELDILKSYESGEWGTVAEIEAERQRYSEYARATFRKDKRVSIRISSKNLDALKKRALEEGIPYQTLISSVLHKYVNGRLVESSE
jgi:predicted DNA binding CopG/RHH family protein